MVAAAQSGGPWGSPPDDKNEKTSKSGGQKNNPWSKDKKNPKDENKASRREEDEVEGLDDFLSEEDDDQDQPDFSYDRDEEDKSSRKSQASNLFSFGQNNSSSGGFGGGGRGRNNGGGMDDFFNDFQKKFGGFMPKSFGGGFLFILALIVGVWFLTGFYRVLPDEQGVVLRFGQLVRTEQPGLRYHLPAPIEQVITPKVTRVNRIEVGFKSGDSAFNNGDSTRSGNVQDVPEESLMLTGDENIVDIDFTVFWVIKDASKFLFQIKNPTETVKRASESAMREVIGQTEIQQALTEARQQIEVRTQELLQKMLDDYASGIEISQVQLQKVDPPAAVIDAFNDVQRARSDKERLRNEAETYRNGVVPVARGDAQRILQEAAAYKDQVVNLSKGDAARFKNVLDAYTANRDVTAARLYFEALEEVLQGAQKVIVDGSTSKSGVLPYLPLNELRPKNEPHSNTQPSQKQ